MAEEESRLTGAVGAAVASARQRADPRVENNMFALGVGWLEGLKIDCGW